jgi:hypothetical protein
VYVRRTVHTVCVNAYVRMHKPAGNCFIIKVSCAAVACMYVGVLHCSCTVYEDVHCCPFVEASQRKSKSLWNILSKNGD